MRGQDTAIKCVKQVHLRVHCAGMRQMMVLCQVYRGTERLTDVITPSFWGRYDKVVCVGSLSKAFGLPGLRLGWLVASPSLIEQVCTPICPGPDVILKAHRQV